MYKYKREQTAMASQRKQRYNNIHFKKQFIYLQKNARPTLLGISDVLKHLSHVTTSNYSAKWLHSHFKMQFQTIHIFFVRDED